MQRASKASNLEKTNMKSSKTPSSEQFQFASRKAPTNIHVNSSAVQEANEQQPSSTTVGKAVSTKLGNGHVLKGDKEKSMAKMEVKVKKERSTKFSLPQLASSAIRELPESKVLAKSARKVSIFKAVVEAGESRGMRENRSFSFANSQKPGTARERNMLPRERHYSFVNGGTDRKDAKEGSSLSSDDEQPLAERKNATQEMESDFENEKGPNTIECTSVKPNVQNEPKKKGDIRKLMKKIPKHIQFVNLLSDEVERNDYSPPQPNREYLLQLYKGSIKDLPQIRADSVRLFISSTFSGIFSFQ